MDLKSGHSLWPVKNGLPGVYPSLKSDETSEVAILGSGITGELVAEGLDVVVLDKRDIAGGSTSASTALLQYEIDTPLTELTGMIGAVPAVENGARRRAALPFRSLSQTKSVPGVRGRRGGRFVSKCSAHGPPSDPRSSS